MLLGGCINATDSADCTAQEKAAGQDHPFAVPDQRRLVSPTDVQLGWFYDNGSGIPIEHWTDFDWSSGTCVVTVVS
jgi:hypothetical protein